jgi:hypothetical protein
VDASANLDDPENWIGGHYELAIELGDSDDSRLAKAVTTVWSLAGAAGCFKWPDRTRPHEVAELSLDSLHTNGQLHGVVRVSDSKRLVCGIVATREFETVAPGFYAPDWVTFFIPLGTLNRAGIATGGYPFGDFESSAVWRKPLDGWMADIGVRLFQVVDYRLGLVGMEVAGEAYSDRMGSGVPSERGFGFLVPESTAVSYYPATE